MSARPGLGDQVPELKVPPAAIKLISLILCEEIEPCYGEASSHLTVVAGRDRLWMMEVKSD